MILISTFEIKISFWFTCQAHFSIPNVIACSLATRTALYLPELMGTVAWWNWSICSDMLAFTRRGFFMFFLQPSMVGYEHVLLFGPGQSILSVGHIVIVIFSSMVATERPALFRIRLTSLTFSSRDHCCADLTPRLLDVESCLAYTLTVAQCVALYLPSYRQNQENWWNKLT